MNKTIYMTYKKDVPSKVFNRWLTLNPSYKIDFSLDKDCISFLEKNFNKTIWFIAFFPCRHRSSFSKLV